MVELVVLQKICIAAIHVELSTDCRKLAKKYHTLAMLRYMSCTQTLLFGGLKGGLGSKLGLGS